MKCVFQTLQIECDGSLNIFPCTTVILKGIIINCAKTRQFDAIGSKTADILWNR